MFRAFIDRLVGACGRRPLLVLFPVLVLFAATWAYSSRLELKSDLRELLPRDSPGYAAFEHQLGRMGGGASLIIVAESPDREANQRFVSALGRKLDDVVGGASEPAIRPLIAYVEADTKDLRRFYDTKKWLYPSLEKLKQIDQEVDKEVAVRSGLVEDLEDPDLDATPGKTEPSKGDTLPALHALDDAEPGAHMQVFRDFPTGYFTTGDGTSAAVRIISVSAGTGDQAGDKLLVGVRRIVDGLDPKSFHPGMQVGYAGDIPNAIEEKESLVGDAFLASALALFMVLVGVAYYFRSFWSLLVIGFPACFGVGCAYAFATAAFGYVNTTGAFLGAIILGNGINYPIVLLSRYREFLRDGQPKESAKQNAVANAFRAELVGACVASIAYGSLVVTRFRGFSQFGWIGFVGMLAVWIATIVVVPATVSLLERYGVSPFRAAPSTSASLSSLGAFAQKHRGPILATACLAVLGAASRLPAYFRDPWEYDFDKLGSRGSKNEGAGHWSNRADAIFGKMNIAGASMLADAPEQVPALKAQILANDASDPEGPLIADILSIDDFMPGTEKEQRAKLETLAHIRSLLTPAVVSRLSPDERRRVEALRPPEGLSLVQAGDLPALLRRRFEERDGRIGTVFYVRYKNTVSLSNGHNLLRIAKSTDNVVLPDGTRVMTASRATIFAEMIRSLERDGPLTTGTSFGAVLVVVLLATHTRKGALAVLAALVAGVILMVGGAALFDHKLNFLNFIALPITFGIGCEYPFNIYDRSRLLRGDVRGALARSGGAVALCSYTTVIGYGSLLFADNQALQSFGRLAISGEIACVTMALVVLPAFLFVMRTGQIEREVPKPASEEVAPRAP